MATFEVEITYREHLHQRLQACDVPEHLHDGLVEYFVARRPTGRFLRSVLENDLAGAARRADPVSQAAFKPLVMFLDNYVAASAWGSASAVEAWLTAPETPREIFE